MEIENVPDTAWGDLSTSGQVVIDEQGVAYTDEEGGSMTSIVGGKDCIFTCYESGCCLCISECFYRNGKTGLVKPIFCLLYSVRVGDFGDGTRGINYYYRRACADVGKKGEELDLPLHKFLKELPTCRFGREWYDKLYEVAEQLLGRLDY